MAEFTPPSKNAGSKRRSFNVVDKQSRFTRDVRLYSGFIIEKSGSQISFAEWRACHKIRLASAECRGGIECDRGK
jgi:hypothetical protein